MLGMCICPRTKGWSALIATACQRPGSEGPWRRAMRRRGHPDARSRLFRAGVAAVAVVSWWLRPRFASSSASWRLGGVARNSQRQTMSGCQRWIWAWMPSTRTPPPALMFQATIRIALDTRVADCIQATSLFSYGTRLVADPGTRDFGLRFYVIWPQNASQGAVLAA